MQIFLNGELHTTTAHTLAELVQTLDLSGKRIAIELNGEIAPRSQFEQIALKPNDRIEIVHAIGGG
jgi:thiamine biosynthesis protein ThiS